MDEISNDVLRTLVLGVMADDDVFTRQHSNGRERGCMTAHGIRRELRRMGITTTTLEVAGAAAQLVETGRLVAFDEFESVRHFGLAR